MSLVKSLQRNFFDTAQYASQLFCKVKIRESMLFFIIKTEKFYAEKNKSYKIHMAYVLWILRLETLFKNCNKDNIVV